MELNEEKVSDKDDELTVKEISDVNEGFKEIREGKAKKFTMVGELLKELREVEEKK